MKNVAVMLSGCGAFDGAEIQETTSTLIHLGLKKASYKIFSPFGPQLHVINHMTGEPVEGASRMIQEEAARIARGAVLDIAKWDEIVKTEKFDALILPGGFGVMKNLSTFGVSGPQGTMRDDVAAVLKYFHDAKRPIGCACIAPMLLARTFPGSTITMGAATGFAADMAKGFGANVVEATDPNAIVVDEKNKFVTTPAYMLGDEIGAHGVFGGIGNMVEKVLQLA